MKLHGALVSDWALYRVASEITKTTQLAPDGVANTQAATGACIKSPDALPAADRLAAKKLSHDLKGILYFEAMSLS